MRELTDSRCISGFLGTLLVPFTIASMAYRDELKDLYNGLDSSLGSLSQLLVHDETAYTLLVATLLFALGTVRALGTATATTATVRAVQIAFAACAFGSLAALYAAVHPIAELADKIK
ncbi:MAG: hypothetical protein JWM86_746 [Thermoleophilia bacterium]|nr:hypothetical protein [Thermoleophilia bacterium]